MHWCTRPRDVAVEGIPDEEVVVDGKPNGIPAFCATTVEVFGRT